VRPPSIPLVCKDEVTSHAIRVGVTFNCERGKMKLNCATRVVGLQMIWVTLGNLNLPFRLHLMDRTGRLPTPLLLLLLRHHHRPRLAGQEVRRESHLPVLLHQLLLPRDTRVDQCEYRLVVGDVEPRTAVDGLSCALLRVSPDPRHLHPHLQRQVECLLLLLAERESNEIVP